MNPGRLDLPEIWRGCDWPSITLKWKDADGNPFDLTGWTPVAVTNGFSLNATVTNRVGGVTKMGLNKAQTGPLRLGETQWNWIWRHDSDPAGVSEPILAGKVEVKNPILPLITA